MNRNTRGVAGGVVHLLELLPPPENQRGGRGAIPAQGRLTSGCQPCQERIARRKLKGDRCFFFNGEGAPLFHNTPYTPR